MDISSSVSVWAVMVTAFLHKTCTSMLDTTIRPYSTLAACRQMFHPNVTLCSTPSFIKENENMILQISSSYLMYYRVLLYFPAIILGPMFGAWGDRSGRILPMMIPNIGCSLAVVVYLLSFYYPGHSLDLFLCGAAVLGLFCVTNASNVAINSYVTESVSKEDRTRKLSLLMTISLLGKATGPLMAGILQDICSIQITFCVASAFSTCAVLLTAYIPESPSDFNSDTQPRSYMYCVSGLKDALIVLLKPRTDNSRCKILLIFGLVILDSFCYGGETDITVLYVQEKPLQWPKSWYSYYRTIERGSKIVFLFLLSPVIFLKLSKIQVVLIAALVGILRSVWTGLSRTSWMMWVSGVLGCMGGITVPVIRSLLSMEVDEDDIGKMYGLMGSLDDAFGAIASVFYIFIYSHTIHIFSGMAYMFQGLGFTVFATLICFLYRVNVNNIS